MSYCDYEFYTEIYFGNQIAEDDFPRLSSRASDYIRFVTKGISDTVEGLDFEAVQKATCAIAEILLDESRMTTSVFAEGSAVASETVGSWSRSYHSPTLSAAQIEYINNRKKEALLMYLGNLLAFKSIFGVTSYKCIHHAKGCRL